MTDFQRAPWTGQGDQAGRDTAQPVLTSDRLVLRPLKRSDAGLLRLYTGDERLARMTTNIPHPLPPGSTEAFIDAVLSGARGETVWAIEHNGSVADGLIGLISLKDDGEIGYWVGAPFWSTGFATEAVQTVCGYAIGQGRVPLTAEVFQDNAASAKVLTKTGFAYVGEGRRYSTARQAEVDTWRYSLAHETWAQDA